MSAYAQIKFKGGYNMDLKHIEDLAEDKELFHGLIVRYFMDFDVDAFTWEEDNVPRPRYYKDLHHTEKIKLINDAYYYYLKSDGATLGLVCDCAMEHQQAIIDGTITKDQFLDALYRML